MARPQFSEGFRTLSITMVLIAALEDCSFRPSCCWIAAKKIRPSGISGLDGRKIATELSIVVLIFEIEIVLPGQFRLLQHRPLHVATLQRGGEHAIIAVRYCQTIFKIGGRRWLIGDSRSQ